MAESSSTASVVTRLSAALLERDIRGGFALLDDFFARSQRLTPESLDQFDLLLLLAQWSDLGYREIDFFRAQYAPIAACDPQQLTAAQLLRLRLAEGYLLLSERDAQAASNVLAGVLWVGAGQLSQAHLFVLHFWSGRAFRIAGDFALALEQLAKAQDHARSLQADKLEAVIKIHQSWLAFHQGDRRLAFELLDQAEATLRPTQHALSLGNIASARGRFARHSGDYERALLFFEEAVSLYDGPYCQHPNRARALVNAAYVKRLIALELRSQPGGRATAAVHSRALAITQEAMELLRSAGEIYARQQHQAGTGSVLINRGHLLLDSGELDEAGRQAQAAFELGQQKSDRVLLARARILQSYVELACSEEQMESAEGASSSSKAVLFADEAVALAKTSQNKRLMAGAFITRGLAATDLSSPDWAMAAEYAQSASELLVRDDRDHLFRELTILHRKLNRSKSHDDTLRRWMSGSFDGKTFQEMEEEFAEMIIPQIWIKLGRSVTNVARELSMSPKKVRRVLRSVRLKYDSPA